MGDKCVALREACRYDEICACSTEEFRQMAEEDGDLLNRIIAFMREDDSSEKYCACRKITELSAIRPDLTYPVFPDLVRFLNDESRMVQLSVITAVQQMLALDAGSQRKWKDAREAFLKKMGTASIAVHGALTGLIREIYRLYPEDGPLFMEPLYAMENHRFGKGGTDEKACLLTAEKQIMLLLISLQEDGIADPKMTALAGRLTGSGQKAAAQLAVRYLKREGKKRKTDRESC